MSSEDTTATANTVSVATATATAVVEKPYRPTADEIRARLAGSYKEVANDNQGEVPIEGEEVKNNNVVEFPGTRVILPDSAEEAASALLLVRTAYIKDLAYSIAQDVYRMIDLAGFDLGDEQFFKDNLFIAEAIKSAMFKGAGYEHFIQQIAEEKIVVDPSMFDDVVDEDDEDPE